MKRLHLTEIHDLDWCPRTVRDGETDYLQFVIATMKPYAAMVPILTAALQRTGTQQVLDLCSGAAGPWPWLQPILAERGVSVSVCLTDKYPNVRGTSTTGNQSISYHPQSVDAREFPRSSPASGRYSQPSTISALSKRAQCWPMRFTSARASPFLRPHSAAPRRCC
jgi:hypothetical protein